ncbi:MAG: METTL5 family protein [Thermoplasmata archaeon]|nr:METTL5 family protein [Thermoplasmata archaeon]
MAETSLPGRARRGDLVRQLATLQGFASARPEREQVLTPPEAATTLLFEASDRGDLVGRSVVDLGCGTGILAIGAALLGATPVTGVDGDDDAVATARKNASLLTADCAFTAGPVEAFAGPVDTVVMNPPFGAQRRHADRPFWETAYRVARRRIYAFSSTSSRTFIADSAVARRARVEAIQPVPWRLPHTFPHHRKRSVELPVDLWVLSPGPSEDDRIARE